MEMEQKQPFDLSFLEIRRDWYLDRERGTVTNAVRISRPEPRKVYLRHVARDPVRQYYYLQSLCLLPAERADRMGRFVNSTSGRRLIRFLDGKSFRAAWWAVIVFAALYFGAGIIGWATR